MSPDELITHRLAELERDVRDLQAGGKLETVDAAVQAAAILEQAQQIAALRREMRDENATVRKEMRAENDKLWAANEKLRGTLMSVLAAVTGGAVIAALAAVVKAGGLPS